LPAKFITASVKFVAIRNGPSISSHPDVAVIGAGVIGLTTAITLAEMGLRVVITTEEFPEGTTSATAGALWGPWMAEPAAQARQWAAHTLDVLTGLAHESEAGVRLVSGMDISNADHDPPDWFTLLPEVHACTPEELPPGFGHGHGYAAPLVDMPTHLAYLSRRLISAGGEIKKGRIDSIEAGQLAPRIINCAGIGARRLANDAGVFPVRGQHVVVRNPGLTEFLEVDTGDSPDLTAIYPHGDHAILGGTAVPHVWSRIPDPVATKNILQRCASIEPRLEGAEILRVVVGLRPTRDSIRITAESDSSGAIVVHNYGHGGAGVSLSWGCAALAAELAVNYST
jgi:D-amino-acid oxidase